MNLLTEKFPKMIGSLRFMVLDEADKMFEMGFLEQVDGILSKIKSSDEVCKLLFSATMQPQIQKLVTDVMVDPVKIQIGIRNATASTVQ